MWYTLLLTMIVVCTRTHVLILMTVSAWVSVIGTPSRQFPKPIQNTLAPPLSRAHLQANWPNCLTLGLVLWDTAPIILFLPKILAYYSSIIPNSFRCPLFSKLYQHNLSRPTDEPVIIILCSASWAVTCMHTQQLSFH